MSLPIPFWPERESETGDDQVLPKSVERENFMTLEPCQVRQRLSRWGEVRSEEHTSELQSRQYLACRLLLENKTEAASRPAPRASDLASGNSPPPPAPLPVVARTFLMIDRRGTRLTSSHAHSSYAVFSLNAR